MDHLFFVVLNIIGTFMFAVSGVSVAISKDYDLFGIAVLGFATAIGGGTLRDMMLGVGPVSWMSDHATIITVLAAIIVSSLFLGYIHKLGWWNILFDGAGLGVFTLVGMQKGIDHGLSPLVCVLLGTITGAGGGVIRDVLSGERPMLFQKELYASVSIAGGAFYFLLRALASDRLTWHWQAVACIVFIVALRVIAVRFNWSLPRIRAHRSGTNRARLRKMAGLFRGEE